MVFSTFNNKNWNWYFFAYYKYIIHAKKTAAKEGFTFKQGFTEHVKMTVKSKLKIEHITFLMT